MTLPLPGSSQQVQIPSSVANTQSVATDNQSVSSSAGADFSDVFAQAGSDHKLSQTKNGGAKSVNHSDPSTPKVNEEVNAFAPTSLSGGDRVGTGANHSLRFFLGNANLENFDSNAITLANGEGIDTFLLELTQSELAAFAGTEFIGAGFIDLNSQLGEKVVHVGLSSVDAQLLGSNNALDTRQFALSLEESTANLNASGLDPKNTGFLNGLSLSGEITSLQSSKRIDTFLPQDFDASLTAKIVLPYSRVNLEGAARATAEPIDLLNNTGINNLGFKGALTNNPASHPDSFLLSTDKAMGLTNSASYFSALIGSQTLDNQPQLESFQARSDALQFATTMGAYSTSFAASGLTGGERLTMPVTIQFGQPQWANMVAERSAMMASQRIEFAELQLDPPELGPLQVKVTVNQDQQASVSFVANNQAVREALEHSSHRLRELLEEQSINLVDVDVSEQGPENHDESQREQSESVVNTGAVAEDENMPTQPIQTTVKYGIDSYV